jgi:hypothetical protein
MAGHMDDVGGTLTAAAQALGAASGGDLGHAALNAAAGQLMTGLGGRFGALGIEAQGLGQSLLAAQQTYGGADATSAGVFAGLHDPPPILPPPAGGEPEVTKQPYYGEPTKTKQPYYGEPAQTKQPYYGGPSTGAGGQADPEISAVPIIPAGPVSSGPDPAEGLVRQVLDGPTQSEPNVTLPYAGTGVTVQEDGTVGPIISQ